MSRVVVDVMEPAPGGVRQYQLPISQADAPARRAGSWLGFKSRASAATRGLGIATTSSAAASFVAPINEWHSWAPRPRMNPDNKVLLTLDKSNFPMGVNNVLNAAS
jgi:hypothetical protein